MSGELLTEGHVEPLDLARWQFGITTVYHFLFVPITIGLAFLVLPIRRPLPSRRRRPTGPDR